MLTRNKTQSLVGLDIEAGSVAAAEVSRADGVATVGGTAIAPLEPGIVSEGEVQNPTALSEVLSALFDRSGLPKRVRVGLANQRVVVRTLRLPLIEREEEIDTAVRFQAQEQIPMPLEQAAFDYSVVSRGAGPDGERRMDVIAVAARQDMLGILLKALRGAGLRPEGIDLSAFGMIRALDRGDASPVVADDGTPIERPATLFCHLGDVTNIAVARGDNCLFTRVSSFGLESIAQQIADREDVSVDDARDLLSEPAADPRDAERVPAAVGATEAAEDVAPTGEFDPAGNEPVATAPPSAPLDATLAEGVRKIADEVKLSLEFYGAQEGAAGVDDVVLCGPGTLVPGIAEQVEQSISLPVVVRTPPALDDFAEEDAARLTVPYGLALEG